MDSTALLSLVPSTAAPDGGLRVLVVERDQDLVHYVRAAARRLGASDVASAAGRTETLDAVMRRSPDVVVLDLDLCDASLVEQVCFLAPACRVVVLADRQRSEPQRLLDALAAGAVGAIYEDALAEDLSRALRSSSTTRPVLSDEVAGLLLRSYVDSLEEKRTRDLSTIRALAAAVEVRDLSTGQHLHRVTQLATECIGRIDRTLAGSEEVGYGFMLHDVGKIGIPDAVLNKPGSLDALEWEVMKRHPEMGVKIVEPIGFSERATEIILCHHEHFDGSGYPYGLAGEDIPITARAFAVADAFDAITTDRPYRPALPTFHALDFIRSESGARFDPMVVDAFLELYDRPTA